MMAEASVVSKPSPFVKWVGGKKRLLPELLAHTPGKYNKYVEPFVGGGALFWELSGRGGMPAVIADSNRDVVVAYRAVAGDVDELIEKLRRMQKDHSETHYYSVRDIDPSGLRSVERAARFIYLNKTCFNGLWRVNKAGKFNTPIGKGMNTNSICDEDNLRACSLALAGVRIYHGLFHECNSLIDAGDFVYMDPPYVPRTKESNFTAFTSDGFDHFEQVRLAKFARCLKDRGVHVLLSNSDTEVTRKIYEDIGGFRIDTVYARRSVNSVGGSRGEVSEILIY